MVDCDGVAVMNQFVKDLGTARNGQDWSLTKLFATLGSLAMVINFVRAESVDFQGLGIGLGAMIAAMAAKYAVEERA